MCLRLYINIHIMYKYIKTYIYLQAHTHAHLYALRAHSIIKAVCIAWIKPSCDVTD